MFQFTLFRIPVRVEPFHWVILALLGASGGLDTRQDLIRLSLFMVAGFFSILIHEMGHALTGRKFGARDPQVVLHGMGGVAMFPGSNFNRKESFLVTAAGPAIQILLGVIAWLLSLKIGPQPGVGQFLSILALISIFWAVLNCIPVWPLDGGQMLGAILGPQKSSLLHQISIGVAVVAAIIGLVTGFMTFFPIFLGFMAYQNWQMLQQSRFR